MRCARHPHNGPNPMQGVGKKNWVMDMVMYQFAALAGILAIPFDRTEISKLFVSLHFAVNYALNGI